MDSPIKPGFLAPCALQGEEEYDPLESIPPPAGESPPRPDPPVTITCDATAPVGSICPFGSPERCGLRRRGYHRVPKSLQYQCSKAHQKVLQEY